MILHTVLLVALAPLIQGLLLFGPAYLLTRWISKRLPEGRLKQVLFKRI